MHRLLCALLLAVPLFAAADVPNRTISTSGEATVRVIPDQAVISVGVSTFSTTLAETTRTNADVGTRLLAAVKAAGVDPKDIQIDTLRLTLRYRDADHPAKGIEGYEATRMYSITVRKMDRVESTLRAALDAGANSIGGISFSSSEPRKHRDEARKMAVRAAWEKAQLLAGELNARVGSPITIAESTPPSWGAGYYAQNALSQAAEPSEAIATGEISITANVSVTFDLLPASK